jgi:hypothetical protein
LLGFESNCYEQFALMLHGNECPKDECCGATNVRKHE